MVEDPAYEFMELMYLPRYIEEDRYGVKAQIRRGKDLNLISVAAL